MTTRIHIVNFGPQAIEVETTTSTPQKLYAQQSDNFYVYDGQDVKVTELPNDKIQIPFAK